MAHILIIEDEPDLAEGLAENFRYDGHTATVVADGEIRLKLALSFPPDLIILDIMLPKKSGLDVCRELRAVGLRLPIIMLTARGQEADMILGLEQGADDYMTKPFSLLELSARVKAALRRSEPASANRLRETIGRLQVDFTSHTVLDDKGAVELSAKEWDLLKFFLQQEGRVLSRQKLLDKVWGYDHPPDTRTVDNFIVRLRKKIEIDPKEPHHLLTVHGMGYRFLR